MMTYPTACHLYKKACDNHRMVFAVMAGPCDMSKYIFNEHVMFVEPAFLWGVLCTP